MKTIECKAVHLWDGGDRHNFAFRISKEVSDVVIKRANPNCYITQEVLTVFDSLEEVAENSMQNLRKRAWDKLSPQERLALGLQDPH